LRWVAIANRAFLSSIIDVIVITSIPLVLLLLNNTWIYPKYSNIDEWMYVGYGYNYFDPAFYTANYKISRLPWVLTEALVRGSFPPLLSSWILGFGVLALGNIALYFALRISFGRLPALFAGIFTAGLTFMHANGGADYHNTLAGAFYCIAMLYCAECARRQSALRDLVFFGACIALSVHTNQLFINLVPILFGQYMLCYRVNHLKFPPLIAATFAMTVGAVGVTVLLGFINLSFGRQFLFFNEQLRLVSSFLADSSLQKGWWEPWSSFWFLNIQYMGIFFAATLLSLTTLLIAIPLRLKSASHAYATIFSGAYLCSILIWVFWQSMGQTALEPRYFAFPLGFPLAGAFAAAISTVVTREVKPIFIAVGAAGFAAATIAAVHDVTFVNSLIGAFSDRLGLRVAAAFSIAFAILILIRWSLWFAPIAGLALCAANALAVFVRTDYAASTCDMNQNAYELIVDASRLLHKTGVPGTKIFVFSDYGAEVKASPACSERHVPLGWLQDAIGATGFENVDSYWNNRTVETVEPERWSQIVTSGRIIGFLTYDSTRVSVLRDRLEAAGGKTGEARLFTFREGDMELPLYLLPLT
jgi:hypothetical protein